jgi:hypothetical protein
MQKDVLLLSYSRGCLYNHRNGVKLPFRGSSLSRTKPKSKEDEAIEEAKEILGQPLDEIEGDKIDDSINEIEGNIIDDENTTIEKVRKSRVFSPRTRRKVGDKAFAFMYTQRKRSVAFLTLSFINKVTDQQGKKILNTFLTTLRKNFGHFNYLWVAERQDGKRNKFEHCTGNIHYHLLTDAFVPVVRFNALWVLCQYNAGIVNDTADEKLKKNGQTIFQMYAAENYKGIQGYLNPLDIKPVHNVQTASAYVTKYITKNDGSFDCLIWHCSRGVSRLATAQQKPQTLMHDLTNENLNTYVSAKTGKRFKPSVKEHHDSNGKLVATTVQLLNREHFHKYHLQLLNEVNAFFLNLEEEKKPKNLPPFFEIMYNLN